ncbi:MAG: hypothetical protein Q8L90_08135 [Bacteroidota bacterium]|nr:hypothetical protein [Bacteroidota bacterium]
MWPEGEAIHRAVLWIAERRLADPNVRLPELLDEAGLRFDLTPVEQESLRTILTLVKTEA